MSVLGIILITVLGFNVSFVLLAFWSAIEPRKDRKKK